MKKISLSLFLALLFIPSLVYAEDIVTEADLRTCLSGVETTCTVTDDITLTSNLTLPSDKTLQFSDGAKLFINNGYTFEVNGHLFMDEGSNYSLNGNNSNILFGNSEHAFYASGTPEDCDGIFGTASTMNLCAEISEVALSNTPTNDNYIKITFSSDHVMFDVKGGLRFNTDTEIPAEFIISTEDPSDAYLLFEHDTVNNGIINTNIEVYGKFTNNTENGLTKYINVRNDGTFINNKDITITGIHVYNGTNTFTNNANVTILSQNRSGLNGIINNTGTITYIQQNPDDMVFFGYNKKNYTGNYPEITYTKNLDYSKRLYLSDTFIEDSPENDEYKSENGLLLYSSVTNELNYYNNIMSADKNEYNVVASTSGFNNLYLELLFDPSQQYVNVEYENIEGKNMMFDENYFTNSIIVDNNSFSRYYNSGEDYYDTNYYYFHPIEDDKPIYFKYKVKGFTTGEEVLIQGAITPNDELSALFESNGGSYTYPVFETTEHLITKPTDPTKTGYTFKGWYTETELTNRFDFETPIEANVVLYASWEALPENPKTQDNIGIYMIMTIISLLGFGYVSYTKIRN